MGTKPHHSEAAGIPANCKGYELHSWKRPFEAGLHGVWHTERDYSNLHKAGVFVDAGLLADED